MPMLGVSLTFRSRGRDVSVSFSLSEQNALRLVSGAEASPSGEWVAHVVFLCSEDDDLELVSLVHRAREERIGAEVLPGVDHDAGAILDELDGLERDACVLFCGKGFTPAEALGFRHEFQARYPNEELLVLELDTSRTNQLVEAIVRRLVLKRSGEESVATELPVSPNGPSVETKLADEPLTLEEEPERSKRPVALLAVAALLVVVGFAGWQLRSGEEPASDGSPAPRTQTGAAAADPVEPAEEASPAPVRVAAPVSVAEQTDQTATPDAAVPTQRDVEPDSAADDQVAEPAAEVPAANAPARPRSRRRRKSTGSGVPSPSSKSPGADAASESKPSPKGEPTPKPEPKRRAKLIDDGLLHTTD